MVINGSLALGVTGECSLIDLVMVVKGLNFQEAVEFLQDMEQRLKEQISPARGILFLQPSFLMRKGLFKPEKRLFSEFIS